MCRYPHLIFCLILTVVILAIFGKALNNGFVGDDHALMIGNPVYRNLIINRIFLGLANGLEYLPIRDLSLAIDYRLFGENPVAFHASGLLIYVAACLAAYWATLLLAQRFTFDHPERLAFVTTLLFGLHPIHAEAVGMLTCRNVLLSGLFVFLATGSYLRLRHAAADSRIFWLIAALGFFLLALLSKATSITLPLALMAIDLLDRRNLQLRRLTPLAPFFLLAAGAFFLFRTIAAATHAISQGIDHGGILGKVAVALQIPFFYLGKLLLPFPLGTEYPDRFVTALFSPAPLAALCGLSLAAALLVWLSLSQPLAGLAGAWFVAFILPILNLFKTYPTVADRYIFLSSYGFALLLGWGLCRLADFRKSAAVTLGLLLALGWGALTVQRLPVWQNNLTYWQNALAADPNNHKAIRCVGLYYYESGQLEQAFAYFKKAQEVNPLDPVYDYYLGYEELKRNNPQGAIPHLVDALMRKSQFIMALYDLGAAYDAIGNREQAISAYRRVLTSTDLDPQGFYKRSASEHLQALGALP